MSIINQDSQVIENGRRAPLTDVDAPLRDQVVQKLYKALIDLDIGQKVDTLWRKGVANKSDWLKRQQAYLSTWDEHLVSDTEGPFTGSSQLHIPMPLIVCKTFHARMFQAIMGMDPPFFVKARNQASIERVATVADTMRYYVMDGANHGKGIEEVVDRWLWDWVTTGVGLKKWRWDVTYSRYIDVQEVVKEGAPIIQTIGGKETAISTQKLVEEEVAVTRKTYEGPVCDLIDAEDITIIGGNGDPDLADAVLHRDYFTASDLWTLVDKKVFNKDAVKKVIEGGKNHKFAALGNDIKTQRAMNAGQTTIDDEQNLDRYEIIEAHLKMDVDGSGINADVIAWVHLKSRELLRATYLRRVSPSGERPFVKIDFQPRKGQEFGTGLVEMLYPLSQEMDAIHNMRIDFGILSVMPFGFYRASSGIDPATIQLEPGALIPVDNPASDVIFPNLGNRTVFGFQEEQAIQTMIERLTSISDINLGVISGQGATRTATGSRLVNNEMSSNLDIYLKRANRGWKKSIRYMLHMLQLRIPAGTSFRLTGDDGKDYWRTIRSAKDLEGDFDLEVMANSASSNQGIMNEQADQILQLTLNPLLLQTGLVGQPELYEAVKNKLQALGVKDWGRYLVKMDPNMAYAKLTPEQEANLVLHRIDVPVIPQMDHQGFIAWFQMAHDTDEILGQFSKEQTVALARQAKKHEQMLQALQSMQAQQANVQQMRMNAQASQQQAPTAGGNPASMAQAGG